MCDAANDRVLVSPTCQLRHMLADLDTLDIGLDRFEFTAHFDGRIRLEIKGVLMGWAAFKKNENTRPFGRIGCFRRMHTQVLGQRQSRSQHSDSQHFAAFKSNHGRSIKKTVTVYKNKAGILRCW